MSPTPTKPMPGSAFAPITVPRLGGGDLTLGTPGKGHTWQAIIVYRGKHCPICHRYAKELETHLKSFHEAGVEVVLVSGDPEAKAQAFLDETKTTVPVGYGLTIPQMHELGLWVSDPRDAAETDQPFAEPGFFVVNGEGALHFVDISNASFARPELGSVAKGIAFHRQKNFPIRGRRLD